jgi:hypothetical protein
VITFDEGDPVEMLRENTCREHAPDTPPDDDRMAAGVCTAFVPMLR